MELLEYAPLLDYETSKFLSALLTTEPFLEEAVQWDGINSPNGFDTGSLYDPTFEVSAADTKGCHLLFDNNQLPSARLESHSELVDLNFIISLGHSPNTKFLSPRTPRQEVLGKDPAALFS